MSDGSVRSHSNQDSMDTEQETEFQFNESEKMESGASKDPFQSHDDYTVPNQNDISPSNNQPFCSTTVHDIMDCFDDYQFSEITFQSHEESNSESNLIESFPPKLQSIDSMPLHNDIQINQEQIGNYYKATQKFFASNNENHTMSNLTEFSTSIYQPVASTHVSNEIQTYFEDKDNNYQETERPFESQNKNYPMSTQTESFPSIQGSVGSATIPPEIQTDVGEIGSYYKEMERIFKSHNKKNPMSNLTEEFPSIFQHMDSTSKDNETQRDHGEIGNNDQVAASPIASDYEGYSNRSERLPLIPCEIDTPSILQQSGNSCESLSELQGSNLSVSPMTHENLYNRCTTQDDAILRMSDNNMMGNNPFSASPGGMDASASQQHFLDQIEPMGIEAHRRPEDRCFVCPFCEKNISYKSRFDAHWRYHTGEKPYSCDMCDKKFSRIGHRTEHRRSHTGEKPYKCSFCDKIFRQSSALNAHVKNVHKKV